MSKEDFKDIKSKVSKDVWKKLKILSITKEISLDELVKQVLESFVAKKKFDGEENTL